MAPVGRFGCHFGSHRILRGVLKSTIFEQNLKKDKKKETQETALKQHDLLIDFISKYENENVYVTLNQLDYNNLFDYKQKQQIINLGILTHEETLRCISKSKGVIFPSELESFGLPIIEAAILCKPIIYWGQDFIEELVLHPTHVNNYSDKIKKVLLKDVVTNKYLNFNYFNKFLYENM